MRISRVVTRQGDGGRTQLVGGTTVDKHDPRIEAVGAVDELNAFVGAALAKLGDDMRAVLGDVQQDLFDVGADLATREADRHPAMHRVGADELERLEGWIDVWNASLPPLTDFVLPGGSPALAALHVARTVCRRAERRVSALQFADTTVDRGVLRYLNRLSDLLFVAARRHAALHGEPETIWRRDRVRSPSPRG
jgi:cob(I)alamin adenosyltransferase